MTLPETFFNPSKPGRMPTTAAKKAKEKKERGKKFKSRKALSHRSLSQNVGLKILMSAHA